MAKQLSNVSASSFDDTLDEHDSFDVELTETSQDEHNFDVELGDADHRENSSGNGDGNGEDQVTTKLLCC